jgi:hypothetical protein
MPPQRFPLATVVALGVLALGCTSSTATSRAPEQLYLKVEVQQGGKTVAAPNLLGFEGRHIIVEKRAPKAAAFDYRLVLTPKEEGAGYGVGYDLELPGHRLGGRIGLLHGEERRVLLDDHTQLKLLLMRVDSPEFRALMLRPGATRNAI